MPSMRSALSASCFAAITAFCSLPAQATWSIVVYDSDTQEVAVGSATCLHDGQVPGINLVTEIPAIVVGQGAGAAQSLLDANGQRRQIMRNGILNGDNASVIRDQLITLPNTGLHQHGIAGAGDTSVSHTGNSNFVHASGTEGRLGSLNYAIQGNVLAGREVVTMTEAALLNTAGDLPAKLMAAMEAARDFGGDGRCSCPAGPDADSCGSPPPNFDKSAHVGFMLVSRFGDSDGSACSAAGCATGDYFMVLNVAAQPANAPDPVNQLRDQYDTFQQQLENRPDAIQSGVSFNATAGGFLMEINLADWRGIDLGASVNSVNVVHANDSANHTSIGPVQDNGDGSYTVILSAMGNGNADDRFVITIDDGQREVVIPPNRAVLSFPLILEDGFELIP